MKLYFLTIYRYNLFQSLLLKQWNFSRSLLQTLFLVITSNLHFSNSIKCGKEYIFQLKQNILVNHFFNTCSPFSFHWMKRPVVKVGVLPFLVKKNLLASNIVCYPKFFSETIIKSILKFGVVSIFLNHEFT